MKNTSLVLTLILALAGCGTKKNPVGSDLTQIRKEGKVATEMGPAKPTQVTNTVIVKDQEKVNYEVTPLDQNAFVISLDPQMSFNEGQSNQYKIRARSLIKDVQIKLVAENLPTGATLTASPDEKDLYLLSWTPAYHTIASNENMKTFSVDLKTEVLSAPDTETLKKLKDLNQNKKISLFLFKNQELPSDLKINGLPSEVKEGTEPFSFTVTALIPGMDKNSAQKPRLVVSYDGMSYSAGHDYLEMDGSRYVVADSNKKDPEYLGKGIWKFTLQFDTKNISVQPELAKDGKLMSNADGTYTRLSFKIYNAIGLSTPETLAQVKILYNRPIATPRFDLSGLAQKDLEVSRGEKIDLKFIVSSADTQAHIQVTQETTNLPGSPAVQCQSSSKGDNIQNCRLTWNVPCDVSSSDLTGALSMTAVNSADSSDASTTHYTLNTKASSREKKLCTQKGKSL